MEQQVRRIYVEKRKGFDVEARGLYGDLKDNLGIKGLRDVRIINRYDIAGLTDAEYIQARTTIFAEPPVDIVYDEVLDIKADEKVFAMEYLPGQYDQRADSAAQCVQILTQKERPVILSAKVIILEGAIPDEDFRKIKEYCINPVESREAGLAKPATLAAAYEVPADVAVLGGFIAKTQAELKTWMEDMGLAMSFEDLIFCQTYFRDTEKRDPTLTEIKVIDTYWSDHCRHTTFLTKVKQVDIEPGQYSSPIAEAYGQYRQSRKLVYGDSLKDMCLMDIAVVGMKEMRRQGLLNDLDESDEINACSIVVNAEVNGHNEEWLVMFKNETHNHPTEIEPFGGAATCLGGAIRDPLSGRAYVYQAMRLTGSGDPRARVEDTLPGKLPQRKITIGAAAGYSSYGNQIGLATGQVTEVYDQGFIAKRMEIGAVIGAVPRRNVVRAKPVAGDVVVLLGGRTGRDGCGGATGSSKAHTEESLAACGAEVQKGNPPTERKIQRLFRNPKASGLIKRCNDFGAGGVAVAIGELTEGLRIDLDKIPKKYEGLDGTELAISESQERMAVVVAAKDAPLFARLAGEENLETTVVAEVTSANRLTMLWRGKPIVDISREFLNTNGVRQTTDVRIVAPPADDAYLNTIPPALEEALPALEKAWLANLAELNVCSQKGLVERFDSTIGAATVLMPFGGRHQATPAEGMAAKLPVLDGETSTATIMTCGYNPQLAQWSPFHGALYAVVEAVTKVVALGGDYTTVRLSLQEYFEKLGKEPKRWGKPFSALLGAFYAQKQLGVPAIGGKDSMSGTFKDLSVPPTLAAFAVTAVKAENVISPEFKQANSLVVLVPAGKSDRGLPDFERLKQNFAKVRELVLKRRILAAHTVKTGGVAAAVSKMCFGNRIGMNFAAVLSPTEWFTADYGSIILELDGGSDLKQLFGPVPFRLLGHTQAKAAIRIQEREIPLEEAFSRWERPLEGVFPTQTTQVNEEVSHVAYDRKKTVKAGVAIARPRIFMPVFPGTNCEYDSAKAFERAGGAVDTFVIRNLDPAAVEWSIAEMAQRIRKAQIIMIPGGFSAGDEPDGSGKFIAVMFRNPKIKEAVMDLIKRRDGLILGICNGFQALIKLGLVPFGEIIDITEECPTLTYNKIGRHVSSLVETKVVSNLSPWFNNCRVGDIHTIPISHGE